MFENLPGPKEMALCWEVVEPLVSGASVKEVGPGEA